MSKKRRNNMAARTARKRSAMVATLMASDNINRACAERRVRAFLNQPKPVKTLVDPRYCRRLFKLPGISSNEADFYMRNSAYRVAEEDGLRLY